MDLFDLLGPAVASEFADRREALPRVLHLVPNAAEALATELRTSLGARTANVLCDARTREAAGDQVLAALRATGIRAHEALVPDLDGHSPVCDDATKARLAGALPAADIVLAVGGGVLADLAKWLAFERDQPAAVFATAASMNGYAAANVAPAVAGVKTLVAARAHGVIAADPAVLARAPRALTAAGLGDVIARSVSGADWRMNAMLFEEPYSAALAGVLDPFERRYLAAPEQLATGDETAIAALFEGLVVSGAAMTLHGSSLPASGGEHLVSHALDMRARAEGGTHDLHGRQVGVATIFVAALYERVLALDAPRWRAEPLPFDAVGWGTIAPAVAGHHAAQSRRLAEAVRSLLQGAAWSRLRETLGPLVPAPAQVKGTLARAGAAHRLDDIGCDRERFLWAALNAAQMRERFTSLDLAWATGVLPSAADEIIDAWLM